MRILFAVDLTEPRTITDAVIDLADRLSAELLVLHVFPIAGPPLTSPIDPMTGIGDFAPYALYDPELQHDIEAAEEAEFRAFLAERFKKPIRPCIRRGVAPDIILEDADAHDVDWIVLGKHHHSRLERLLLSPCASAVAERSTRPVLLLPLPRD